MKNAIWALAGISLVAMGVVGAEYREIKITDAPFEMPAVTFIPPMVKGGPVIMTGQGLKWERREEVKLPLYAGHPVTVVDLFATGEIAEGCTGADRPAVDAALKAKGLSIAKIQLEEYKCVEALLEICER